MTPDLSWQAGAACAAHPDPDLWFPQGRHIPDEVLWLCEHCPVRQQCLAHALSKPEWFGVWGGVSTANRDETRKRIRGAA